jgi:hypothetical protein
LFSKNTFFNQVEAYDMDQEGTKNSEIRYEIIHGNYEKKFFIDSISGQISVMEPLTPGLIRNGRQANFSSKIQRISKNILTKHFDQEGVKTKVRSCYRISILSNQAAKNFFITSKNKNKIAEKWDC